MTTDYKEKIGELVGIEVIEKNGIDLEKLRKIGRESCRERV